MAARKAFAPSITNRYFWSVRSDPLIAQCDQQFLHRRCVLRRADFDPQNMFDAAAITPTALITWWSPNRWPSM